MKSLKIRYQSKPIVGLALKVGLVYLWSDALSFYSSYSEGFYLSGTDFAGQPFEAEKRHVSELGMKFNGTWF